MYHFRLNNLIIIDVNFSFQIRLECILIPLVKPTKLLKHLFQNQFLSLLANYYMPAQLQSWVEYPQNCEFPIQNLPYGAFTIPASPTPQEVHLGLAIGHFVLDLHQLVKLSPNLLPLPSEVLSALLQPTWNLFMAQPRATWQETREIVQQLLAKDAPALRDDAPLRAQVLLPRETVQLVLPVTIGDYTDFYASKNHAYNVGVMFRGPDNALQPNWTWLPVGYHGRASSVVVSGTPLHRPCGQVVGPSGQPPATFEPSSKLDFELEMGFFVGGAGNPLGQPMSIDQAHQSLFGCVLLNDWSARDIQRWEYVPLGPFGSKNFGTTISPWIVSQLALEQAQGVMHTREEAQDPKPLEYLREADDARWTPHIELEVEYTPAQATEAQVISRSNSKYLYWSAEQMLAHHSVTGCNMRPGDLLGSGTISSTEKTGLGSLLEITWNGKNPITFDNGVQRTFLQDGDSLALRARATAANGEYVIGFGTCQGTILPPFNAKNVQ